MYKRSGVVLSDIQSAEAVQTYLFDEIDNRPERTRLMKTVDRLNQRYGVKTIGLAAEGDDQQAWKSKNDHRSGNYLTDIDELMTVKS